MSFAGNKCRKNFEQSIEQYSLMQRIIDEECPKGMSADDFMKRRWNGEFESKFTVSIPNYPRIKF